MVIIQRLRAVRIVKNLKSVVSIVPPKITKRSCVCGPLSCYIVYQYPLSSNSSTYSGHWERATQGSTFWLRTEEYLARFSFLHVISRTRLGCSMIDEKIDHASLSYLSQGFCIQRRNSLQVDKEWLILIQPQGCSKLA